MIEPLDTIKRSTLMYYGRLRHTHGQSSSVQVPPTLIFPISSGCTPLVLRGQVGWRYVHLEVIGLAGAGIPVPLFFVPDPQAINATDYPMILPVVGNVFDLVLGPSEGVYMNNPSIGITVTMRVGVVQLDQVG